MDTEGLLTGAEITRWGQINRIFIMNDGTRQEYENKNGLPLSKNETNNLTFKEYRMNLIVAVDRVSGFQVFRVLNS